MKNKELAHDLKHSLQSLTKILIPVGASIMTGDPLLAAGATSFFLETFFGIRGRLKIERIEEFLIDVDKDLEVLKLKDEVDFELLEKHQDLFENIILQVARTQDENKLRAYRKILLGQFSNTISINKSENYTKLIGELTIQEFAIFRHFHQFEEKVRQKQNSGLKVKSLENISLEELKRNRDTSRNQLYEELSEGELQFLFSSLVGHGLIIQNSSGGGTWRGSNIFGGFVISSFGFEVIDFLKNE